jgi:hypothetical protein
LSLFPELISPLRMNLSLIFLVRKLPWFISVMNEGAPSTLLIFYGDDGFEIVRPLGKVRKEAFCSK